MKKNKKINLATTLTLCAFVYISVAPMINELKMPSFSNKENITVSNYQTLNNSVVSKEIIPEFTLNFELQKMTIKETEEYKITSFIPDNFKPLLTNIDYNYKDPNMSNHKITGKYEIVIVFKDIYNRKIEKSTFLTIEKKATKITKTNNKTTQEAINNKSKNIITTKPLPQTDTLQTDIESQILKNDKIIGTYGRIYFSSLYSVALYTPSNNKEAQQIVDNVDSAAIYKYGNIKVIADHAYQGFTIIKSQNIGDYIYIKKLSRDGNYELEKYIVKEKINGKNTISNLITNDNRDIGTDVNYSLALYTCNTKDGYNITILLLDKI